MSNVRLAAGATIRPGDVLEIHFSTLPSPTCLDATINQPAACDTLVFNIAFTTNPGAPITARLFNSSVLLGTFQTSISCLQNGTCAGLVPSFVAPGSVYDLGSPVIDFTSILNGTIDGILKITVTAPTDIDLNSADSFIEVLHAQNRGTGSGGYFLPVSSLGINATCGTSNPPFFNVRSGPVMGTVNISNGYREALRPEP